MFSNTALGKLKPDPPPAVPKEEVPEVISKPDPEFKDALFMVKYDQRCLQRARFFKTGVWHVWNLFSGAGLPGTGSGFPQEQRGRHEVLRQGPSRATASPRLRSLLLQWWKIHF